jgi:hypothetical protein
MWAKQGMSLYSSYVWGGAGSGSGDLVTALLAPAGSASTTVASSASLTSALESHGDHFGSATFLVIGGIFPLVAVTITVITVLLLLVQGYCCSCEISACVVIGSSMIAGDGDHVIQSQFVCLTK